MEKSDPFRRPGFKLIYELKEGETYAFFEDKVVVCHPDRPPKIILQDGTEEEITLGQ